VNLLILGGTRFVGRHIARAAMNAGASVTLFHRNETDAPELAACEHVYGDRMHDLHRLGERRWDAVIDTSAYAPGAVEISARYLSARTAHYTFISTISVYDADRCGEGIDEDSPVMRLPAAADRSVASPEHYGALKVLCEAVVRSAFRHRAAIVRPGVVAGPYDPTDRFTYWAVRKAAGGTILAPHSAEHHVQYIDARDLAEFVVRLSAGRTSGLYNAVTGAGEFTFGDVLRGAYVCYAAEDLLEEQSVRMWSDLPLWIPSTAREYNHVHVSNERARARGLRIRDVGDTMRDTLEWARAAKKRWGALTSGLTPSREAALLGLCERREVTPRGR
jgi:2'-hydroxyisoflavone reductase